MRILEHVLIAVVIAVPIPCHAQATITSPVGVTSCIRDAFKEGADFVTAEHDCLSRATPRARRLFQELVDADPGPPVPPPTVNDNDRERERLYQNFGTQPVPMPVTIVPRL